MEIVTNIIAPVATMKSRKFASVKLIKGVIGKANSSFSDSDSNAYDGL